MKKIIISHGDKGGVGKSMFASLALEYIISRGQKVTLVEGDPNIGDVARRYAGVDGINVLGVNLDKSGVDAENAINALFSEIETLDSDYVVINSPANAAKTIDFHSDLIVPVAHDLGFEVLVAWMVGQGEESASLSSKSHLCEFADKKIAVLNYGLSGGLGSDHFAWMEHPARDAWLETGGIEGSIPLLISRVSGQVKDIRAASMLQLAKSPDSPLNLISRQGLSRWLDSCFDGAVAPLIGEVA